MAVIRALSSETAILTAGGETGKLIATHDWAATPLGPIEAWPNSLKTTVSLIVHSSVPMALLWGEDGIMLYNDAYSVFAGDRHPQLLGSKVREGWPEVADFNDNVMKVGLAGGTLAYRDQELTVHRKGAPERVWMNLDYSPVYDQAGRAAGIIAIVVETTERVLADRRTDAERERLIRLFDQAPGFICIMRGPEHVYEFANRAHDHLFQRPNIVGKSVREVFPDLDGQGIYELLDEVYTSGRRHVASRVPLRYQFTPGGPMQERVLDFIYEPISDNSGEISGIFCEGYDVTEAHLAQEALRKSEELSRRVWASSDDCIKVLSLDGRLEAMSEGGLRALGIDDATSSVGQSWTDWFEGKGRDAAHAAVSQAREGRSAQFEARLKTRRGEVREWDSVLTPVAGADGRPEKILALSRDITARRQAEAALRASQARRAEQLQGLAEAALVVGRAPTLKATLDEITQAARRIIGAHQGVVSLTRGPDWAQSINAVALTDKYAGWRDYSALTDGSGIYAWVCEQNRSVRMNQAQLEAHPRWRGFGQHAAEHPPMRGWLAAPLVGRDGRNLGLIQLSDKVGGSEFDEADEAMLVQLAQIASAAVEQSLTETALRHSEEQLRLATDAAEIGLWDLDIATDTLFWPPRVKAMFGISADVPISMADYYAGLHPEDAQAASAAFAAALDPVKRALYDVEYRTVGKETGVVRWVAAKGRAIFNAESQCVRVIGTAIDITARKATEERLRELNETLEQRVQERTAERNRVWSMSRDLLAVMGFDGYLKAINPAWEATLGFDEATLLAKPFPGQVHPDDHAAVEAVVERLRLGETIDRFEDRLHHADGSWRWIAWGLVPDGDVFYAVGRDVTAEKEATADLERAQAALQQAQKMEAVGQLTGGIAHDFNNLLQGVVGSLDLIRRKPDDRDRVQRWAEAGLQAAERGAKLTGQLLAFSRAQRIEARPLIVEDLVGGMRDLLERTLGPLVKVTFDLDAARAAVLTEPTQLEMAVLNLAINARDVMPENGQLTIATRLRSITRDPEMEPGEYVELRVSDTGSGMPPEVAARAFDPFFTTKDVGKGTGLGLSQVYGIARLAGGTARIESRPGSGTTVRVFLRRTDREVPTEAVSGVIAGGRETPTATVLVVDDDADVRRFLVASLEGLGYRVEEASDGHAGLAALERFVPDVMVVDFAMPGMNGAEVARAARVQRPDLSIIFASGYADTAALMSIDGGAVAVLRKPFRVEELEAVLADALSGL
jgi:PAS domain S-box-containing protein